MTDVIGFEDANEPKQLSCTADKLRLSVCLFHDWQH